MTLWRSFWHEPRPVDAPGAGRLDWLVVGLVAAVAVLEGVFRPDVAWRPLAILLALALVPALLWRRDHPLAVLTTDVRYGVPAGR